MLFEKQGFRRFVFKHGIHYTFQEKCAPTNLLFYPDSQILTTYNLNLVKREKWKTKFSVNHHFALLYYKGEKK